MFIYEKRVTLNMNIQNHPYFLLKPLDYVAAIKPQHRLLQR